MRKTLIAGNWKMNGSRSEVRSLCKAIAAGVSANDQVDIAVFPPYVHLQAVQDLLSSTIIKWGAQNLYSETSGAYTGEIAGPMLVDYGCQLALIGHSERRALFGDTLEQVANKFKAAQAVGLLPVLCVGETLAEKEQQQTENVLKRQVESVIDAVGIEAFDQAIIAYEPVWAIGTGLTATPEQAQSMHAFIRQLLMQRNIKIGSTIQILYGGSVKSDNAAGLFAMPDIDGALVGGASLDATSFLAICDKA